MREDGTAMIFSRRHRVISNAQDADRPHVH